MTKMNDKIKLEDMTLREIRELKEGYQIRVAEALVAIRREFVEKYDCGFPLVSVETELERECIESESFTPIFEHQWVVHNIKIKFSKEND